MVDAWYLKSNRKVLRSSSDTRNNMREMRTRCANARWPKNISRRNSVSVTELTRSERDETHSIQKTVLPYQSPFLTITIVCRDNSSAGPAVCRAGDRPSQVILINQSNHIWCAMCAMSGAGGREI